MLCDLLFCESLNNEPLKTPMQQLKVGLVCTALAAVLALAKKASDNVTAFVNFPANNPAQRCHQH